MIKPLTEFIYEMAEEPYLRQGDFLELSPEVRAMLEEVGSPYAWPECRALIVLTQSCDLVPRPEKLDKCDAKHVCLAVVKQVEEAALAEVAYAQSSLEIRGEFTSEKTHNGLGQFLDRLLNNNEPGLFFLHEDPPNGVPEHLCAFLSLTLAVDSSSYYDRCLAARRIGIRDIFQAKLGWLAGTMYSRVGTPDLRDFLDKQDYRNLRKGLMDNAVIVLPNAKHQRLVKSLEERPPDDVDRESIRARIDELRLNVKKRDLLIERVDCILERCPATAEWTPDVKRKVLAAFGSDLGIKELLA